MKFITTASKTTTLLLLTTLSLVVVDLDAFVAPSFSSTTPLGVTTNTELGMTKDFDLVRGFDTICLHAGYLPDPSTTSRGVPIHRTAPYAFKDTETAANLFGLRELGNIYSKLIYIFVLYEERVL